MRILHFSTTDLVGGAGKAAFALHRAELAHGLDSMMYLQRKESDDCRCYCAPVPFKQIRYLHYLPDMLLPRLYPGRNKIKFSTGFSGINIKRIIAKYRPDIVHLHWIASGFIANRSLKEIQTPIVWTLHDMLPFTGGCHHSLGCTAYQFACGRCKVLNSKNEKDLSSRIITQKKTSWQDLKLHPVAVSHWLADCASQSALFRDYPIRVIGNSHDLNVWTSRDPSGVRKRLGLDGNKKIILFCVGKTSDPVKGVDLLVKSIQMLPCKEDLLFVLVGTEDVPVSLDQVETCKLGTLTAQHDMAQIYAAADVVAVPSYYESFGMVASEAMACGTPVVAFDNSGLRDIIDHKTNGYLARAFDPNHFAKGIEYVLNLPPAQSQSFSVAGRAKIEQCFSATVVVGEYLRLYGHAIAR